MLSEIEQNILRIVYSGRNSLDHFVDSFHLDCADARVLAERLCTRNYLELKGYYFTNSLTYQLTDKGKAIAMEYLSDKDKSNLNYGLLSEELSILKVISKKGIQRRFLEDKFMNNKPSEIHSILVALQEKGFIKFKGFIRVFVSLTSEGASLLNNYREDN